MISVAIVAFVAVEHLWFMMLEMFFWTKPIGQKIFRRSLAEQQFTATLAANQGLYNGFLAVGLAWSLVPGHTEAIALRAFFLACVTVAGLFGGVTVSTRIAIVQAVPAVLGLLALWLGR